MSYQLSCPNCTAVIPPQHINIQKMVAACPNCGAVFNFEDTVAGLSKRKRKNTYYKQPKQVNVIETDQSVTFSMPILAATSAKVGVGIAMVSSLIPAIIIIMAMFSPDSNMGAVGIGIALPLMLVVLGLFSLFYMRQTITLTDDTLTVAVNIGRTLQTRQKDLAYYADFHLEEMAATRDSTLISQYSLFAMHENGHQELLLSGLPPEIAFYLRQELAAYLQADDPLDATLDEADSQRLSDDALDEDGENVNAVSTPNRQQQLGRGESF